MDGVRKKDVFAQSKRRNGMKTVQAVWYSALSLMAISLGACDPHQKGEKILTSEEACSGPAKMRYSKYGGFQFFVSCKTPANNVWEPMLYGNDREMVGRKVDEVLGRTIFRCTIFKHVGAKSGGVKYDHKCELLPE